MYHNNIPGGETAARRNKATRMTSTLSFVLNGQLRTDLVADNRLLLDYLRETPGLAGRPGDCDDGGCGACTVLIDDTPALACLTLAVTVKHRRVDTMEGLTAGGLRHPLHETLGSQCGECAPGIIMAVEGLLRRHRDPDAQDIRAALGGNLCRCRDHENIVEAVREAARRRAAADRPVNRDRTPLR